MSIFYDVSQIKKTPTQNGVRGLTLLEFYVIRKKGFNLQDMFLFAKVVAISSSI